MTQALLILSIAVNLLFLLAIARIYLRLHRLEESLPLLQKQAVDEFKKGSGRTRVGKTVEKFIPMLDEFHYDPSDARFIGDPVDYVVFDGLTDGEVRELVFIEVKSGKEGPTKEQRQIERCALLQQVRFGLFKVDAEGNATLKLSKRPDETFEAINENERRRLSLPDKESSEHPTEEPTG